MISGQGSGEPAARSALDFSAAQPARTVNSSALPSWLQAFDLEKGESPKRRTA
jgi:hypothetical protein